MKKARGVIKTIIVMTMFLFATLALIYMCKRGQSHNPTWTKPVTAYEVTYTSGGVDTVYAHHYRERYEQWIFWVATTTGEKKIYSVSLFTAESVRKINDD